MGYSGSPDEIRVIIAAEVDRAIAAMNAVAGAVGGATRRITGDMNAVEGVSSKVQNKMQNLATAVGFSMGALATSSGGAIEKILKSMTGLAFALNPIAGGIVLAVASIAEAFRTAEEDANKASEAITQNFGYNTREAYTKAIVAVENYVDLLKAQIDAETQLVVMGGADRNQNVVIAKALAENYAKALDKLGALRRELTEFDNDRDKTPTLNYRDSASAFDPRQAAQLIASYRTIDELVTEALGKVAAEENKDAAKETAAAWEESLKQIGFNFDLMMEAWRRAEAERKRLFEETKADWENLFNTIPNLAEKAMRDVIRSGQSMRSFWKFLNQEIAAAAIDAAWRSAAGWAAAELAKENITRKSVMERVAVETWGAIQTVAQATWAGLTWIVIEAAKAGAAAWAAIAGIPFVGPFLAPAVAAATLAGVLALGSKIASAAGGFDIPAGTNPITQLHAQEMVLPKEHADTIRRLGQGGGGGDVYHVYAWDSQSMDGFLRRHGGSIARAAQRGARDGALDSGVGRRGGPRV